MIGEQILLADIGDVGTVLIFRQQMIERLLPPWADIFRDRLIPLFAVGKNRVDIKDYAAKIERSVSHDFADSKPRTGMARNLDGATCLGRKEHGTIHGRKDMALGVCKTRDGVGRFPRFATKGGLASPGA